ncbi:hypothetical protein [Saccharomonospora cyanea]|uniref:Uncharacterized protein n=1 Tax=Saccharomonospora cyanea NA-134 TaxID=882082 RepID=H5XFG6_9PSEU|nr:hypothetical protein [Saccharomonospora cyanea]EHR62589.1 hypothetical protein SaccyDRAFT_3762 [Saccharomonospora cyanea NA-134]
MIVVQSHVRTASGSSSVARVFRVRSQNSAWSKGAIELTVDESLLLGTRHWDYVFPLWAYFADAMSRFRRHGEASFQFPDQPIEVDIERAAEAVRLRVRGDGPDREAVTAEPRFVQAVRARGASFFRAAIGGCPNERHSIERSLTRLLEDPPGMALSDSPWERRLDVKHAAAFRHAERMIRRPFSPSERETLIEEVAGRRCSFEKCIELVLAVTEPWGDIG